MEQDINILMEQYRQALISVTNNSGLPIGVIRYIFSSINDEIQIEYNRYLQQKAQEAAAAQQEVVSTEEEDEVVKTEE